MSRPRPIVAGKTVMVTRRCVDRRFLLRPDKKLDGLFGYLLAVGAKRFGVDLHALVVMSNHYHLVATDKSGKLPVFLQWFHALLARSVNHRRQRSDTFWGGGQAAWQLLADAEAVRHAVVYVLANPVNAGLVAHGRDWPGLRSSPQAMIASTHHKLPRPKAFFRGAGPLPKEATLRFTVPPALLDASSGADATTPGQVVAQLTERLEKVEDEVRQRMAADKRTFKGRRAVSKQRPSAQGTSPEPQGQRFLRLPLFRAGSSEALAKLYEAYREFVKAYRVARERWLAGEKATFPHGTYLLPRLAGVSCHASP